MGTYKNKQRVTLSLNSKAYAGARAILQRIPGKPSVSALVDDLLRQFVGSVGPLLDEVEQEPGETVRSLMAFHGNLMRSASVELDELVRELERKEARQDPARRMGQEALAQDVVRGKARTRKAKAEDKED